MLAVLSFLSDCQGLVPANTGTSSNHDLYPSELVRDPWYKLPGKMYDAVLVVLQIL
jgi:hypothetical protein